MKKLQKQNKENDAVDTVLGGKVGKFQEDHRHMEMKTLELGLPAEETIRIKNPVTGKEADVVISRTGTSQDKLGMIMLAPDATKEQKDSMLAQYLFEQGKESASFLAELFASKGVHFKQTQAFKRQMRFDFEMFADRMVHLLRDISVGIHLDIDDPKRALESMAERLQQGSDMLIKQRQSITEARMKEKGYGVYINRAGQAYSIFDEEIEKVVAEERKMLQEDENDS